MMGKFASVSASVTASVMALLVLTILLGASGLAQSAPAEQAPATSPPATGQQPAAPAPDAQKPDSSQEPADEESTSHRKRIHDYKNWVYNVGAGANLDSGPTKTWVRQGGFVAGAGVARNANKYLGLRADFIFANLPLRDSTQNLALATGATTHIYTLTLDPIINVPMTSEWGGYAVFGPSFSHRSGSLTDSSTIPGSPCNGFWNWWGACQSSNFSIPLGNGFANSSLNQFGYNVGVGVTRKMPSGVEIYLEFRLVHGSHNNTTTDYRPITLGFRW
jgi:Outer membrane protein beta-barrel domain